MRIRFKYTGTGYKDWASRVGHYDREFLLRLFRSMLRIRIIEEEIEKRYHEDQMKTPIHLVIGQEATSVGCCATLLDQLAEPVSSAAEFCLRECLKGVTGDVIPTVMVYGSLGQEYPAGRRSSRSPPTIPPAHQTAWNSVIDKNKTDEEDHD